MSYNYEIHKAGVPMSYNYEIHKAELFTEGGQRKFLKIRDHVKSLLHTAGAFRMEEAWKCDFGSWDSWSMLAAVDRLVELGEIREIDYGPCAGQHRIFTWPR